VSAPSSPAARAREELVRLLPSLRAAAAVLACLVGGELTGRTATGLVMAVGARRVILGDPGGERASRAANMALALLLSAAAAFVGTLAGHSLVLAPLGMFALGWVLGVARARSDAAGRVAAAPAVLFALALILPGGLLDAAERAAAVAAGGAVAVVLVLGWPGRGWLALVARRAASGVDALWRATLHPEASVRFGLVLAATVSICVLVVKGLALPRGHWVVVSVLVVLRPEQAATWRRGAERLLGTLLGCVLAAWLVFLVRPVPLQLALIFLLMAVYFRLQPTAYGWSLAFFTPAVVLSIGLLEQGNWHWAANRAVDVAAGSLVAFAAALLLGSRSAQSPAPVV
jgi:hypothetical protein